MLIMIYMKTTEQKAYSKKIFALAIAHITELVLFIILFITFEKSLENIIIAMLIGHLVPTLFLIIDIIKNSLADKKMIFNNQS